MYFNAYYQNIPMWAASEGYASLQVCKNSHERFKSVENQSLMVTCLAGEEAKFRDDFLSVYSRLEVP